MNGKFLPLLCLLSVLWFTVNGVILDKSHWTFDKSSNIGSGKSQPLEDDSLFEGDLKIPFDLYKKYYLDDKDKDKETEVTLANLDDDQIMSKSAAARDSQLWPNGEVFYTFHSSVDTALRQRIRKAMDDLEEKTCLRFMYTSKFFKRKIKFQTNKNGCYSSWIGKVPAWLPWPQVINLGNGCKSTGTILHEIGHAIGFWHEQSRPDRDRYVKILYNNIKRGEKHNFKKRRSRQVNYHGTKYDYNSIMHYGARYFVKANCKGCKTIEVSNLAEWQNQGRPKIGNRNGFSKTDIEQVNRMYSCSSNKILGKLEVYIRRAVNLPDTDRWGRPDVYVKVTAVYNIGGNIRGSRKVIMRSTIRKGTSVTWNQKLDFGVRRWTFVRIQVWDKDVFRDDQMTLSETVPLTAGYHPSQKHCKAPDDCSAYLLYNYRLTEDRNDCFPNRCRNGGTCIDGFLSYQCKCPSKYDGKNCQYRQKCLHVQALFGRNLPDKDRFLARKSDPYMTVTAYDRNGQSLTRNTRHVKNNHNPDWNQWLNFGYGSWSRITVAVYDKDVGADDKLSTPTTYYLSQGRFTKTLNCYSGYVKFEYSYT